VFHLVLVVLKTRRPAEATGHASAALC